jgi:hypothetical protein
LACSVGKLQRHSALAGWLYTQVRYVSTGLRRGLTHKRDTKTPLLRADCPTQPPSRAA